MTTHCNYVLSFSDGSVKVGVTSRPRARISEIRRAKRGTASLVRGMLTPMSCKEAAFKTEANICRLLRKNTTSGTREWFAGGDSEFNFLSNTTGMFWILNTGAPYDAVEVSA